MLSRSRAWLLLLAVGALVLVPGLPVLGADTASSEYVIIQADDVVADDLYVGAVAVDVQGVIDGDLIAFATERIVIDGTVTGSVIAVAPSVVVTGRIDGSLRVGGQSLDIDGAIGRDVVAAVWSADLGPGSIVARDVLVWASRLTATGLVRGDLEGTQGDLRLAGEVTGDVDVTVGSLEVVDDLRVIGDLGYRSADEAAGLDRAEVGGVVVLKSPVPPNLRVRALGLFARFIVILFLTLTAVGVGWAWPERARRSIDLVRARPWRAWLTGSLVILSPAILTAVAALMVGLAPSSASFPLLAVMIPVILATAGLVLGISLFAGIPAVGALGEKLPGERSLPKSMLLGSLLAGAVWLLPLVGWLVPLAVLPLGLGGWIRSWGGVRPDRA